MFRPALFTALTIVLVACGGAKTPAPTAPENTETAEASPAPSSDKSPEPEAAPAPPPAPKTPDMPASFTTAQQAFFAQADRLGDAVTAANGDCKKLGQGIGKVASDPAFAKAANAYVSETLKLTPEQRAAAKAAYDDNQKKFDGMKEPVAACKANPAVQASVKKLTDVMMKAVTPLLQAFAADMQKGA